MKIPLDKLAVLQDFHDANFLTSGAGNGFYSRHGIGNKVDEPDQPFERFCYHEEFLRLCQSADAEKYYQMHKGTPFYFMSWLCFDMRSYEKALFYLDAAVSEDVRAEKGGPTPDVWKDAPAARFLTLEEKLPDGRQQVAGRTIKRITDLLEAEFGRFNRISGTPMDLEKWRVLVRPLLEQPSGNQHSKRTIVSALYVFMLEFSDGMEELKFRRGSLGGSNQPFTIHLFTGGLLFESLLKHFYAPHVQSLGDCFLASSYQADFGMKTFPTGADQLTKVLAFARNGPPAKAVDIAFGVASQLRNTTGHNLVWDDVFDDPESYRTLYENVMNALLFLIEKNAVGGSTTTSTSVQTSALPTAATTPIATQTAPPLEWNDSYSSTRSSGTTITFPAISGPES